MKSGLLIRVIKDEILHLFWGYLVTFPLLIKFRPDLSFVPLVVIFVDLDHFVAARGFSLERSLTLPRRPALHSLTSAIIGSLLFSLLFGTLLGYILFVAWLSHLIWDMKGGTVSLFWPSLRQFNLPKKVVYLSLLCLFLISLLLAYL